MRSYPLVRSVTKPLLCRISINKFSYLIFGWCCLVVSTSSFAGWLNLCGSKPDPSQFEISKQYIKANGESHWLFFSRKPLPHCETLEIIVDAEEIEWFGLISREKTEQIDKRIILQGWNDESGRTITEIIEDRPLTTPDLVDILGVNQNLLSRFKFRAFGVEERVSFTLRNNSFEVLCDSGQKPAGVLFDIPQKKLPYAANVQVVLNYTAEMSSQLGIADDSRYQKGDPVVTTLLPSESDVRIPIPYDKLDKKQNIHWSLVCPNEKARITLYNFELQFVSPSSKKAERGLWIWKPDSWRNQPDELLSLLKKYQSKRVFISLEMSKETQEVLNMAALEKFIAAANTARIDVWVVEGDPHATLPQEQQHFVQRAQAIENFNQNNMSSVRLAGIQYDIEPYLVNGWELEQQQWFDAYVATLRNIKAVTSANLEIVIPFWWQFKSVGNEQILDKVAPYIDSINVMNYRTSPQQIQLFAQPFLEWGVKANKKVSIALEAGPVRDEDRWHYASNQTAELFVVKELSYPVLILLHSEKTISGRVGFKFFRQSTLSGDQISFQYNPAALIKMLPELESVWSGWESFHGTSLHGFESELSSSVKVLNN